MKFGSKKVKSYFLLKHNPVIYFYNVKKSFFTVWSLFPCSYIECRLECLSFVKFHILLFVFYKRKKVRLTCEWINDNSIFSFGWTFSFTVGLYFIVILAVYHMVFIICLPLHDAATPTNEPQVENWACIVICFFVFFSRAQHYEVFVTLMVKLNGKDHEAMKMALLICQQPADFCFLFYPVTANG